MPLNYKDLREALTDFDRIAFEGRVEGWDDNVEGEKAALRAARQVLAEIDGYLTDRLAELGEPT